MSEADEASAWRVGGVVDGYRLDEQLGAGELGVVFRGVHEDAGVVCAIKVVTPERASAKVIAAFCTEGRSQAAVAPHPNLLRTFASGSRHGSGYLVSEFAAGGTLIDQLRARPPHPLQAAYVASQLARGVEHLNTSGVVHRDLKPSNVLFDGAGVPKVGDFGLGRFAETPGELSRAPYEASPEQAAGEGAALDARTDVYSLGAILYHMLTGRPPFYAPHKAELLQKIVSETPPEPSSLAPAVPADLSAVCMKALAKRPDARYPSAAAFGAALEDVIRANTPRAEASGPPRKHLLGVAAGALALLVLTVGGSVVWDRSREPQGTADPVSVTSGEADAEPADAEPPVDEPLVDEPPVDEPLLDPEPEPKGALAAVWAFEPGDRFRARYQVTSNTRTTTPTGAGLPPSSSETTFVFAFAVKRVDGKRGRAQLDVTVESFAFSSEGGGRPKRSFSPGRSGKASAYRVLLGKSFGWSVDLATGRTLQLTGLRDLQKALYLAVNDTTRRREFYLPSMTATAMGYGFDRLFYLREDGGPSEPGGWTVGESAIEEVESTLTAFDATLRGEATRDKATVTPSMRREVRVASLGEGSVELTWSGAGPFRMAEGSARVAGGRVQEGRVSERLIASYGKAGDTIVETVYTFKALQAEPR